MINTNLKKGKNYTKREIEKIFGTNFGYGVKGITLRRWHDGNPYTIIFSRSKGPYSDEFKDEYLIYDGEGLNKDQKLTAANKAVIESNDTGRIIFGFRQEERTDKWEYIGILKLVKHEYKFKNRYKRYEFKFKLI